MIYIIQSVWAKMKQIQTLIWKENVKNIYVIHKILSLGK
jgi:hypothetical protein